jgi:phage N-6-adenine-methyltransferase
MNVHFMSCRDNWKTPKAFYQALNAEFGFTFDPCPPNPTFNGLKVPWQKTNYVNPPYGRQIGLWLEKAIQEQRQGNTSVFLIPSRTDTRWWHDHVMKADEIRFIKGRLHFDDHPTPAPFPSALVVFRGVE